jgi:hypothetical protein
MFKLIVGGQVQKIVRPVVVLITLFFTFSFFFRLSFQRLVEDSPVLGYRASVGTEDDPDARAHWEWMRLQDPSTGEIPLDIRSQELQFASRIPSRESIALMKSNGASGLAALSWSSRGPYNVGGRTRALGVDASNENVILAGGASGGMWRSTDGGSSWTKTTLASQLQSVTCLAQDTRQGKTATWYYGTGELSGNSASGGAASYRGDGLFKSTDGGKNWTHLTSPVPPQTFSNRFQYVWNIVTDATNQASDVVYAATHDGIQRSTDGGTSWSFVRGNGSPNSQYTDVAITSTGVLYATLSSEGPTKGIWRSTDGVNWTSITPTGWPGTYGRVVIGIAPSNEQAVYFLASTPSVGVNGNSLWKYPDNGLGTGTWVNRSSNLPNLGGLTGTFDSQGGYDLMVRVHPANENTVFVGGTNLFRSTDGFSTTTNTSWVGGYTSTNTSYAFYPNHHPDQHTLVFSRVDPNIMFSGCDGGVARTTNNLATSVSWASLNNGYLTTQLYTVAIDPATTGSNVVIGGLQDNGDWFYNSASATDPWKLILTGDGAACAVADGATSYYFSYQYSVCYRELLSSTGAFQGFTRIDPTGGAGYLFINPFVLDPNNNKVMYLAGGSILWRNNDLTTIPMSSNNTTTVGWDSLNNSRTSGTTITAIGVSKSPANRVYYGTSNGKVYRLDAANAGDPLPIDVWTGKGLPVAYVSCIAVDPTNGDNAMAVFSNYSVLSLFYTTNGGTSWSAVSGNLEQNPDGTGSGPSCRWGLILSTGGTKTYFVATSTGLYSTTTFNGMSTVWAQEGASTIGNVVVDMVVGRAVDGVVVAATHGNGTYSTIVVTSVLSATASAPLQFGLDQNYPNPFNPSTTISFTVPRESHVRLVMHDAAGREIRTLVNEVRSAGNHRVQWDGRDDYGKAVASGVYFSRMESGSFVATQKMTLLK